MAAMCTLPNSNTGKRCVGGQHASSGSHVSVFSVGARNSWRLITVD